MGTTANTSTDDGLETWQNQAKGRVVVKKRGEYGVEVEDMVAGGRKLHISTADRRMNQERAANEQLDPFTNGMLVMLGDRPEEFAQNANQLTESDMVDLVKAHPKTFAKKLGEITNPIVIGKLLEIAKAADVSVSRVESLEARLDEVDPNPTVKIKSHAPDERQSNAFAVTKA